MTAQTTDFSGLLFYNPAGPGFDAVASATITGPNSMDEGATEIWELVTWAIPDGDIYYKIVPDGDNLNAGRFTGGLTGILTVTNNRTSIGITVSEDNATSITGQSFDIRFSKTLNGTPFATKYGVNVNDTSQSQPTITYPAPTNHSTGFSIRVYDTGSWGGDFAWLTGKTPFSTVYNASNVGQGFGPGGYTGVWMGYFVPTVADDYRFYFTVSDFNGTPVGNDAVCKGWYGNNATLAGSVPPNITINGAGVSGGTTISLVPGDWYPIYLIAGFQSTGGNVNITVSGGGMTNETSWNAGYGGHNTDTGGI